MIAMAEELGKEVLLRDAANVLQAECVVIIGTREQAQGLNCGHCGFQLVPDVPRGTMRLEYS